VTTTSRKEYATVAQVRRRRRLLHVFVYAAAIVVAIFAVFPLYWMAVTAVKPQAEIVTPEPVWWPSELVWDRFPHVMSRGFAGYLRNSLIVALATTGIGLAVATLAGYALARFRIPLRQYLALTVLATQLFPAVVLLIPLFIVMRNLGLTGSLWGLVVAYLAFITPLMIWILRGFFLSVPNELEEAALIDGCTRFMAMRKVILPLAGPGIAAVSIFAWIAAWNEFLFALTFVRSESLRTLPVGLAFFVEQERVDHGAIMAASLLFTTPVVIFFLFVHKKLTTGLVAGAVKG
jgi:ABC-type glycerol-3-phosphate transport system permease component